MIEDYHDLDVIVDKYSKYGNIEINESMGVVRINPFVEVREEIIVDSGVPEDTPLDEIPPHLKQTLDLYFVNSEALHPSKHMIRCVSPGVLQTYQGKVWVDIPYREDWRPWEEYIKDMETIDYPFIVLPTDNFIPRSFMLIQRTTMNKFLTLLNEPNRQITLEEFERTWVFLFHPDALGTEDFPMAAWMHVAESPNAYVDVVTPNGDGTVNVVFTIPPVMSLNQGMSSVTTGEIPVILSSLIKRCSSESSIIPRSGDQRFVETMEGVTVEPTEMDKHLQMWAKIYERYGWKNTDATDSVNETNTEVRVDEEADPFKMAPINF